MYLFRSNISLSQLLDIYIVHLITWITLKHICIFILTVVEKGPFSVKSAKPTSEYMIVEVP